MRAFLSRLACWQQKVQVVQASSGFRVKGGAIVNAEADKYEARAAPITSGTQALRAQFTRTLSYMKQAAGAPLSVH